MVARIDDRAVALKQLRGREAVRQEGLVVRAARGGGANDELRRVEVGDVADQVCDLGSADAGRVIEASVTGRGGRAAVVNSRQGEAKLHGLLGLPEECISREHWLESRLFSRHGSRACPTAPA